MGKPNENDNSQESNAISKEFMLSTLDNPYNPYTNWAEWYNFDCQKGYYTCSYLARVFEEQNIPYLSEEQKYKLVQQTIQDIIDNDSLGLYCKVSKDEVVKPIELT